MGWISFIGLLIFRQYLRTFFQGREQEITVQLFDIGFGTFARAGPDDGASLLVDFHHVLFGALARKTEDLAEYQGDVTHQVHGVIVHDDVPRDIDGGTGFGLLLDDGICHDKTYFAGGAAAAAGVAVAPAVPGEAAVPLAGGAMNFWRSSIHCAASG